jgi:GTP-binding protein
VASIDQLLRRARYLDSIHNLPQLPPDAGIEVAIAGRSNAGKSSLINRICDQKSLARTSRTPGRTRQLVFFQLDPLRHVVDLPGYGYAKVSGDLRQHWQGLIQTYLERRQALAGLIIVMDIRHPLKDSDKELVEWAAARGLPQHLVLTKADKLGRSRQAQALQEVENQVSEQISAQCFSATTGQGSDTLLEVFAHWFQPERVLTAEDGELADNAVADDEPVDDEPVNDADR